MRNWQRWTIALVLPFAIGALQCFEEGKPIIEGLRYAAHTLLPSLIGLNMTLNPEEKK